MSEAIDDSADWMCGAFEPLSRPDLLPYRCTERSGHVGPHRAVQGVKVLAVWQSVKEKT